MKKIIQKKWFIPSVIAAAVIVIFAVVSIVWYVTAYKPAEHYQEKGFSYNMSHTDGSYEYSAINRTCPRFLIDWSYSFSVNPNHENYDMTFRVDKDFLGNVKIYYCEIDEERINFEPKIEFTEDLEPVDESQFDGYDKDAVMAFMQELDEASKVIYGEY